MRWSYSASRSFRQCQRQWFFKNIASNAKAKDPFRRQAYLLSKLQSISAWRGKIVDDVLSQTLIPNLNRGIRMNLRDIKRHARDRFDRQLAYARRHPINDPNLQVSSEGEDFSVFHVMEYDGEIPKDEIENAWGEIESALVNLYSMDSIKCLMRSSDYIISQRPLQFTLMDGITVIAYPDVIVFQNGSLPTIIDWKVHTFGTNDAWLQLAIYAIALCRCSPHSDFPSIGGVQPNELALYEVQLLTNVVRKHSLEKAHIVEAEEYMLGSAYEISCLSEGKKYTDLNAKDFRTATYAETCQRCAFRTICWETIHVH